MIKKIIAVLLCSIVTLRSYAQTPPVAAADLLQAAMAKAKAADKKIFVFFHASWCTWCRRMEASMNDGSCRSYFNSHFETVSLVVSESAAKKNLENPGADSLKTAWNGVGSGLPFWLILDSNGQVLADSRYPKAGSAEPGDNIGCPATADEVNYFLHLLRKTAGISKPDEDAIRKRFRANED